MSEDPDRTASLMTPAKLAQMKPRAAASPGAWLDQMASDAGHLHVRHLKELGAQLRAQAEQRDYTPLTRALAALERALPELDFSLLEPKGWLARATGKAKSAAQAFTVQHERAASHAQGLKEQAQAVQKVHQAQAAATDRTLVEFEVEWRAIEKILDQGARWLQDMRNQLKTRQAAVADAAAQHQIDEDAARCEILVTRLKLLRAVTGAAQQAHQQAQAVSARRSALVQGLQQLQAGPLKNWEGRIGAIASSAGEAGAPAANLEEANEARQELQRRLAPLGEDCRQLQIQEQQLADQLGALGEELKAAA